MITARALKDPAVGYRRRFGGVMWVRTAGGWRTEDGRWSAERWEGSYSSSDQWRVTGPGFPPAGESYGALRQAGRRIFVHRQQEPTPLSAADQLEAALSAIRDLLDLVEECPWCHVDLTKTNAHEIDCQADTVLRLAAERPA